MHADAVLSGEQTCAVCTSVDMRASCAVQCDLPQCGVWPNPSAVDPSKQGCAQYVHGVDMYLALFAVWTAEASIQVCKERVHCAHITHVDQCAVCLST